MCFDWCWNEAVVNASFGVTSGRHAVVWQLDCNFVAQLYGRLKSDVIHQDYHCTTLAIK